MPDEPDQDPKVAAEPPGEIPASAFSPGLEVPADAPAWIREGREPTAEELAELQAEADAEQRHVHWGPPPMTGTIAPAPTSICLERYPEDRTPPDAPPLVILSVSQPNVTFESLWAAGDLLAELKAAAAWLEGDDDSQSPGYARAQEKAREAQAGVVKDTLVAATPADVEALNRQARRGNPTHPRHP